MLMAPCSVDSICTDPPYHLTSIVKRFGSATAAPAKFGTDGAFSRASAGFMGKQWDGGDIAFDVDMWREAWRVLKPGGYLLAFSGSRTYHRMACAIEDAGFEIRDQIMWIYGSGFPKSHDVSKAIDRVAGAERDLPPGRHAATDSTIAIAGGDGRCVTCNKHRGSQPGNCQCSKHSDPVTDAARQWEGWGTALKPAHEPIVVARKPLIDANGRAISVAQCVQTWGTGAINIDGCRIEGDVPSTTQGQSSRQGEVYGKDQRDQRAFVGHSAGRFPANVIHDGSAEVIDAFPSAPGQLAVASTSDTPRNGQNVYGQMRLGSNGAAPRQDADKSATRFFYCAKASRADRDEGLAHMPIVIADPYAEHRHRRMEGDAERFDGAPPSRRANIHPTVKPTDLMRYLTRLVTPPGGTVFDPFTGSGSTGKAAMLEGMSFIGCEMTPEYVPIAEARIADAWLQYVATLA